MFKDFHRPTQLKLISFKSFFFFTIFKQKCFPKNCFVNIRLYHCLKYYKTVHSLSVLMDYVP